MPWRNAVPRTKQNLTHKMPVELLVRSNETASPRPVACIIPAALIVWMAFLEPLPTVLKRRL